MMTAHREARRHAERHTTHEVLIIDLTALEIEHRYLKADEPNLFDMTPPF
jgi:hypothetical protein